MTTDDILRKQAGKHSGFMPTSIAITTEEIFFRRLRTIPNKIAAYFHRSKIADVYREPGRNMYKHAYIIVATDGTKFYVEY